MFGPETPKAISLLFAFLLVRREFRDQSVCLRSASSGAPPAVPSLTLYAHIEKCKHLRQPTGLKVWNCPTSCWPCLFPVCISLSEAVFSFVTHDPVGKETWQLNLAAQGEKRKSVRDRRL